MKIKTRKLIAAITATALLGSALGVGTYSITKSNNDLGFKGTYNLNAFAAASESTTTVGGNVVDITDTLTVKSTDNNYTLLITIVDTSDLIGLENVYVGYSIGTNYYNGLETTLSQIVYSSLTINTGKGTETINASSYNMTNATNPDTDAVPMFIIAEVETTNVGSNTASLFINCAVSAGSSMNSSAGVTYNVGQNIAYLNYTAYNNTFDGANVTKHNAKEASNYFTFRGVVLTFVTTEDNLKMKINYTQTANRYFYVSGDSNKYKSDMNLAEITLGKAGVYTLKYDGNEHKISGISWSK